MSKLDELKNTLTGKTTAAYDLPVPHPGQFEDHMLFGINCTAQEYEHLKAVVRNREEAFKGVYVFRMAPSSEYASSKKQTVPEPAKQDSIAATLAQRDSRYGDFTDHARLCQGLMDVMQSFNPGDPTCEDHPGSYPWARLDNVKRQALTVIADKIARILSGDPNYDDNWHDIQGYAKLVEDRLPKEKKES